MPTVTILFLTFKKTVFSFLFNERSKNLIKSFFCISSPFNSLFQSTAANYRGFWPCPSSYWLKKIELSLILATLVHSLLPAAKKQQFFLGKAFLWSWLSRSSMCLSVTLRIYSRPRLTSSFSSVIWDSSSIKVWVENTTRFHELWYDWNPTRILRFIHRCFLSFFLCSGILVTATKDKNNRYNYNTTTVVLFTEILKLFVACFLQLREWVFSLQ